MIEELFAPRRRESWEADIPKHREAFLARGGVIQMIPFGESRYNPTLNIMDLSKKSYEYRQQKNADAEAKSA